MKHKFEHRDGRIYLILTIQVWGGDVVNEYDVTDQVMPLANECLTHQLGLSDYKFINGKLSYIGEDKDRYQK